MKTEDSMREIANHVQNEQVPRNVIARIIAKLRSLYHKIMFRYKTTAYTKEGLYGMIKDSDAYIKNFDGKVTGVGGLKNAGKQMWILAKNVIPAMLKNLAGKILWLIDKLLQKLQNTANSAGDKISSLFGKNKTPQAASATA